MKTKGIIIGAIILALIILVGYFLIKVPVKRETLLASEQLPTVDFEATIVSLSLIGGDKEGGDITRPRDTAVVKIDKINSISSDFEWVSVGIEEGKEITISFRNSARPAKIKTIFDPESSMSSGDESTVGAILSLTKEDGYFVYSTKSGIITEETETILPGLDEDSKFKAKGVYDWAGIKELSIGSYEIIS